MGLIEVFNYEKETIRKRELESVKIFARMESVCSEGWKRNFFVKSILHTMRSILYLRKMQIILH